LNEILKLVEPKNIYKRTLKNQILKIKENKNKSTFYQNSYNSNQRQNSYSQQRDNFNNNFNQRQQYPPQQFNNYNNKNNDINQINDNFNNNFVRRDNYNGYSNKRQQYQPQPFNNQRQQYQHQQLNNQLQQFNNQRQQYQPQQKFKLIKTKNLERVANDKKESKIHSDKLSTFLHKLVEDKTVNKKTSDVKLQATAMFAEFHERVQKLYYNRSKAIPKLPKSSDDIVIENEWANTEFLQNLLVKHVKDNQDEKQFITLEIETDIASSSVDEKETEFETEAIATSSATVLENDCVKSKLSICPNEWCKYKGERKWSRIKVHLATCNKKRPTENLLSKIN
jgi:hypothetical protein